MSCLTRNPARLAMAGAAVVCVAGCGLHQYTNPKQPVEPVLKECQAIIVPLDSELVPVRKQIFFLKNDIAEMKDKLWEGGTNQRIARIDGNIDIVRKEVNALSVIRRELLTTIRRIYPAYVEPEIVPYTNSSRKRKQSDGRTILVTLQDQREFEDAKSDDEKMSETIEYKRLIRTAIKQFDSLPDSLKPKVQPIGAPGPVSGLQPYAPPLTQ